MASWSEEEESWGASQQYMESQCSPKEAKDERLEQEDQEVMFEEFQDNSFFEEWTETFLGRDSLGCGTKIVEEEQTGTGSNVAVEEEEASKDDLSGLWSDNSEFMDRTMSLICVEDPSHPRVTEPRKEDSKIGVACVPETQEGCQGETIMSTGHEKTGLVPGYTWEPTTGHAGWVGLNQSCTDRQFVDSEEDEPRRVA